MPWLRMTWGKMFYSDTGGSNISFLFLHGTGCESNDWDGVIHALSGNIRVVLLDFRGHGKSDVPDKEFTMDDLTGDVLALADHLAIQQMVLVGHSLGGMVAMNIAARSSRVTGLVLLEGWTVLRAARAFVGERFYGRLDRSSVENIQQKNKMTQNRFDPIIWRCFWTSVEDFDALSYLQTAKIPIFEVYGEMGRTDSTGEMLVIPDNPQIRVMWISNAGHYLPQERPVEVAEICRKAAKWSEPIDKEH